MQLRLIGETKSLQVPSRRGQGGIARWVTKQDVHWSLDVHWCSVYRSIEQTTDDCLNRIEHASRVLLAPPAGIIITPMHCAVRVSARLQEESRAWLGFQLFQHRKLGLPLVFVLCTTVGPASNLPKRQLSPQLSCHFETSFLWRLRTPALSLC